MHTALVKTTTGLLPYDPKTQEWYDKIKLGRVVHADYKEMRNSAFHRKFFALLNLAFEYWDPGPVTSRHGKPQKNFDQFREDVTILAGFYENHIRIDGTVRVRAKSISFAKMDNIEFEKLYNEIINVILNRISVLNKMSKKELNELVEKVMGFA